MEGITVNFLFFKKNFNLLLFLDKNIKKYKKNIKKLGYRLYFKLNLT